MDLQLQTPGAPAIRRRLAGLVDPAHARSATRTNFVVEVPTTPYDVEACYRLRPQVEVYHDGKRPAGASHERTGLVDCLDAVSTLLMAAAGGPHTLILVTDYTVRAEHVRVPLS